MPLLQPGERAVSGPAAGNAGVGTAAGPAGWVGRPDLGRDPDADAVGVAHLWGVRRKPLGRLARATLAALAATAAAIAIGLTTAESCHGPNATERPTGRAAYHPRRPRHDSETIADARALNMALSEATAATWDLARSASEPAARISRQVLDAATGPDRSPAQPASVTGSGSVAATVSVPSLDSLAPDTAAAGAMLQQVGDRLTNGVRPLSDTARHAFGFLLGTALAKPEVPVNPPAQKGA